MSTHNAPPQQQRPATSSEPGKLPALRHQRSYRTWWVADTTALLAGSIYSFIFPLILLSLTGSPVQAGTLAAVGLAARAALTLWGGSMADRSDRARMIMGGGLCGAALTAALAVASASGSPTVSVLCVVHVLMELRGGYFGTVTNAALKDVVYAKQLGRALAANQGRDSVLMLAAAPLGGLLLGAGAALALLVVSGLHLLVVTAGYALRGPLRAAESAASDEESSAGQPGISSGIAAGMRWCFAKPQLRSLLILITVINIGTNGLVTTLIYGMQQRGEAPWVIGLVSTCMGLGMLLGALFAGALVDRLRTGILACSCLSVLGGAMLLMGLNMHVLWLGAFLLMAFLSVPALNASVGGYFMAVIPHQLAGRANSLIMFMALAALPLAPLLTGFGLRWLGMGPTLVFFGSVVVVSAIGAWGSRYVRGIPHPEHWVSEPASADAQATVRVPGSTGAQASGATSAWSRGGSRKKGRSTSAKGSAGRVLLPGIPRWGQRDGQVRRDSAQEFRCRRERELSLRRHEQWIYL